MLAKCGGDQSAAMRHAKSRTDAEARGYFIQAEKSREEATAAKRELENLKAEFLACLTPTGKLRTSYRGKYYFQQFVLRVKGKTTDVDRTIAKLEAEAR